MAERVSATFFENNKASDLPSVTELAHADVKGTLSQVLEALVSRRIYALPVFDNENYIGMISLKEIVAFVVSQFYLRASAPSQSDKHARIEALKNHTFGDEDYRVISETIHKEPVKNHIQSVPALKLETSLRELVSALAKAERVPIMDKTGKIVNIVSQATIIRFILQNINSVGTITHESLQQLNCITKPVRTVTNETQAIVSFAIMVENGYSSLGFMDEDSSHICGVISFKDIRGAVLEGTETLLKSSEDYVNNIRRNDERNITKDIVPTVNCSAKDTLGKIIAKLCAVGIHRLFVREDGASDFTGIVSLSDVLKLFVL
jgi:CBS-domain-containing membrane protein